MPVSIKTKALTASTVGVALAILALSREPDIASQPRMPVESQASLPNVETSRTASSLPPLAVQRPPATKAPAPAQASSIEEDSDDPYEISGFVSPPADEGAVHSTHSEIKTGADMDYEAGLIDDDGNSTAVEIGSEEDEATLRQARIDEQLHAPPRASNPR